MSDTILSTYSFILTTLDSKGDAIIPAADLPFEYNVHFGAFVVVFPAKDCFLTWTLLEGIMTAMYNALYLAGKYKTAGFTVWEPSYGIIGYGSLRKEKNPYTLGIMSAHL